MSTLLVTSRSFGSGSLDLEARANDAGYRIVRGPSHHDLDALRPLLKDAVGWIAGTGPVTAAHFDAAPHLTVIARYGVGTDQVDLSEASARNIVVTNTPGANSEAVADLTVGLMIAGLRLILPAERALRGGNWGAQLGRELGAMRVGIVGFGRIGQGVARRLSGFGCQLLGFDPVADVAAVSQGSVNTAPSIEQLLEHSDVISLHAPGGETIINQARLTLVAPDALLVNTSRPELVDEDAIATALREGRLGGYAADVVHGDTAATPSPLLAPDLADLVTLTPHIGAQTVQGIDGMGEMALTNALLVLSGQPPQNPVLPRPEEARP